MKMAIAGAVCVYGDGRQCTPLPPSTKPPPHTHTREPAYLPTPGPNPDPSPPRSRHSPLGPPPPTDLPTDLHLADDERGAEALAGDEAEAALELVDLRHRLGLVCAVCIWVLGFVQLQ